MLSSLCTLFRLFMQLSLLFALRGTSELLLPLRHRSLSFFVAPQLTLRPAAEVAAVVAVKRFRAAGGATERRGEVAIAATGAAAEPPPRHSTVSAIAARAAVGVATPSTPATSAASASPVAATGEAPAEATGTGSSLVGCDALEGLEPRSPLPGVLQRYPKSCYSKAGTERIHPAAAADSEQKQNLSAPGDSAIHASEGSAIHASAAHGRAGEVPVNPTAARWLSVGRVGGAHGLRGHLEIFPSTAFVEQRFCCPSSRLFFGGGRVGGLLVSREVESGRLVQKHGGKQVALVKLQGINDRAAATALSGFQVYVHPKQSSSLLPPHSVLAADLVGFDVRLSNNPNKEIIGKVADVVSKHDMRLKPEAVGAADDCLEIEFYKDLPARRLLMEAYRDPAAPPPALLASALHALGPDQPPSMQLEEEEPPVLYECEGCGLRFSDCAAAVTHERLCLQATQRSSKCPDKCGSQQTTTSSTDDQDALQWMLQTAAAACDLPTHEQQQQQRQQQVQGCSGKGLWEGENSAQVSPPSVPHELLSLEGPEGRSGRRLGRHFYQRLSLGSLVSWDRGRRFFPKKGEAATDAAERALNFACPSSSGGEASKYAEADWSDTHDVVNLSSCLGVAPGLSSVTCETDKKPKSNSFLLPFVLGVTVEEIKVESKAIAINAPPGLLH